MELFRRKRGKLAGVVFLGAASLGLADCTISSFGMDQVNTISSCKGDQTPILATFHGQPGYSKDTDPVILAAQQLEIYNNTSSPIGAVENGDVQIGLGAVTCRESTNTYYITTIGAQVMHTLKS